MASWPFLSHLWKIFDWLGYGHPQLGELCLWPHAKPISGSSYCICHSFSCWPYCNALLLLLWVSGQPDKASPIRDSEWGAAFTIILCCITCESTAYKGSNCICNWPSFMQHHDSKLFALKVSTYAFTLTSAAVEDVNDSTFAFSIDSQSTMLKSVVLTDVWAIVCPLC